MARKRYQRGSSLGFSLILGLSLIVFYFDVFILLLFVFAAILLSYSIFVRLKRAKFYSVDMSVVDQMNGADFEAYVALVLKKCGFKDVRVTKKSGDFGADILARNKGESFVIQCKRYNAPVGVAAVQEVHTAKTFYKCSKAVVVTNATFTVAAKKIANGTDTALWDRSKLVSLIYQATNLKVISPLSKHKLCQ